MCANIGKVSDSRKGEGLALAYGLINVGEEEEILLPQRPLAPLRVARAPQSPSLLRAQSVAENRRENSFPILLSGSLRKTPFPLLLPFYSSLRFTAKKLCVLCGKKRFSVISQPL